MIRSQRRLSEAVIGERYFARTRHGLQSFLREAKDAVLTLPGITCNLGTCLLSGAFAKETNSGAFDIGQSAKIGKTLLKPGHSKAEWTGPNSALSVKILGKTVATTKGHLKELPTKSTYDAVEFRTDQGQQVDEIDFNNRTDALVLAGS